MGDFPAVRQLVAAADAMDGVPPLTAGSAASTHDVWRSEIETPRGVSHTFSPVKSEFAFDKLAFIDDHIYVKINEFVAKSQYQYPKVDWVRGSTVYHIPVPIIWNR